MEREALRYPINPYHFIRHVIGGKWKMTILHDIYIYGTVRFNETAKNLQVSEKVLSKQLKELWMTAWSSGCSMIPFRLEQIILSPTGAGS